MKDYIKEIEDRYGKWKPSVGLPQIFMDIQNLLALVKAYEDEIKKGYRFHDHDNAETRFKEIKKSIFEKGGK